MVAVAGMGVVVVVAAFVVVADVASVQVSVAAASCLSGEGLEVFP